MADQYDDMLVQAAYEIDHIYPGHDGRVLSEDDPFEGLDLFDEYLFSDHVNGIFTESQEDFDPSLFITPQDLAAYTKDEEMIDREEDSTEGGEDPYDQDLEGVFSNMFIGETPCHPGAEYTNSPAVWNMMMKMGYEPKKGLGNQKQGSSTFIEPLINQFRFGRGYSPLEDDIRKMEEHQFWIGRMRMQGYIVEDEKIRVFENGPPLRFYNTDGKPLYTE